jgi:hypothetical protein
MKGDLIPVEHPSAEILRHGEVPSLLEQIRPQWRAKDLIQRVERLLPVDPSSACQRLLNAAVRDLRDKIQIAGTDIAREVATEYKLPAVTKQDDVESYSTSNIISLSYRMGILSRPDWRRMMRAYEIRRDLEHEDSEYEAGIEDVVYIFKTSIDAVLSRDPITLIRVAEVKDIVQAAEPVLADGQLLDDFRHAPDSRQLEIAKFLLSTALDDSQPDLVRQNANTMMRQFSELTRNRVLVSLATHMQENLGRSALTEFHVRVAASAGVLPYLKKSQRRDFFAAYADGMDRVGYEWRSHPNHGSLLRQFQEFGGLNAVPEELRVRYVKWLSRCFIGVPGGYGQGINRKVFYSNSADPLIREIFGDAPTWVPRALASLRKDHDIVAAVKRGDSIARRYETLVDLAEGSQQP